MPGFFGPGPPGHADRPRVADVRVVRLPVQIVVEHLHARVAAVADVDVALEIGGDRVRRVELQVAVAARADGLHEAAVLVVLHDACVEVAVRDEDIALLIERDVGLAAEPVLLRCGRGSAPPPGMLPSIATGSSRRPIVISTGCRQG